MGKLKTHEQFIYDLIKVNKEAVNSLKFKRDYINSSTEILVEDAYGEVMIKPSSLMHGNMPNIRGALNKTSYWTNKAVEVHGDSFDYSKVVYKSSGERIVIICPIHGGFEQKPKRHLTGRGCPHCSKTRRVEKISSNHEEFINKLKIRNKRAYETLEILEEYKTAMTPLLVRDKYWLMTVTPNQLLNGSGCYIISALYKTSYWINMANEKHNEEYDYSKSVYNGTMASITIICDKHGEFTQKAGEHLSGHGCPICKSSNGEREVELVLRKYGIKYNTQYIFDDCKYKNHLKFDFYIADLNIGIEYDGELHFQSKPFFGGDKTLHDTQTRDSIKNKYCKDNNIKLIRIPYWDYDKIEEILLSEVIGK